MSLTNRASETGSRLAALGGQLIEHLRRHLAAYLLAVILAWMFQAHYSIGVNATQSLPQRLFLIHKGAAVNRDDYVAFRWAGGGPYAAGVTFVKIVAGVPGDVVSRVGRDYYVNGKYVGTAKMRARNGEQLLMMDTGVLGPHQYYVSAPHPDSLDSRYRMTGWIPGDRIMGRAYAIF